MIKHEKEQLNPVNEWVTNCLFTYILIHSCRYGLLAKTKVRWRRDGLTNLDYRLISIQFNRLYTNITVDLLETESRIALANERIKEGCWMGHKETKITQLTFLNLPAYDIHYYLMRSPPFDLIIQFLYFIILI